MYMAYQKCIITRISAKILATLYWGPTIKIYKNPPPHTQGYECRPCGERGCEILHTKYNLMSGEVNGACPECTASSFAGGPSASASGRYPGPWPH